MEEHFKEYEGKRVLVTGGAGCIGSNLTHALLKANVEKIYVLDDLSSSERWNLPYDPNVVFVRGSVLDDKVLKRTFSQKPHYVFLHFFLAFFEGHAPIRVQSM